MDAADSRCRSGPERGRGGSASGSHRGGVSDSSGCGRDRHRRPLPRMPGRPCSRRCCWDNGRVQAPGSFSPVTDMVGGGPFVFRPARGRTTRRWRCVWPRASSSAVVSMPRSARALRPLVPRGTLVEHRPMLRYRHLHATALHRFERTREPFPGDADPTRPATAAHEARAGGAGLRLRPARCSSVRRGERPDDSRRAGSRRRLSLLRGIVGRCARGGQHQRAAASGRIRAGAGHLGRDAASSQGCRGRVRNFSC